MSYGYPRINRHRALLLRRRSDRRGRLKHFSKHPVRYWVWTQISKLNRRHMAFAWISLGTLMLTDLYIMLVASGAFSDPRLFN